MDTKTQHDISLLRQQLFAAGIGARKPVALPPFQDWLASVFARAEGREMLWMHRNSEGQVKAYLAIDWTFDSFFGQDVERVYLNYDWHDAEAATWMKQQLRKSLPLANDHSHIMLSPVFSELWPYFREKAYGVSEISFGGFPALALDSLRKHPARRTFSPEAEGFSVEAITELSDIAKLRDLREIVFRDEPERCWFYQNPGVADQFDQFSTQRLQNGHQWKILRDGRMLGMFGFGKEDRELFGKVAQMDFAVLKECHGLGIGRYAYERMLEKMLEQGCDYFSGATANPSVVHFARIMQRPLQHFEVRAAANCVDMSMFAEELKILP